MNTTKLWSISKYSFLPKNKITLQHIEESVSTLNSIHSPGKKVVTFPYLWKTIFKYDKWLTPSGSLGIYEPYYFRGKSPSTSYLSFSATPELYEIYEKHKTVAIYPYKTSIFNCYSFSKHMERPDNPKVQGFSLNPAKEFLVLNFIENSIIYDIFTSVWIENIIKNTLKNIDLDLNNQNIFLIPELFTTIHLQEQSDNKRFSGNLPIAIPKFEILEYPVYYIELNSNMIAISFSILEFEMFTTQTPKMKLKDLLEKSYKEEKSLYNWTDRDENMNPNHIDWKNSEKLLKFLEIIQREFLDFDLMKIIN